MKKPFITGAGGGSIALLWVLVLVCFIGLAPSAKTVVLQAARVTIVIKDVKLLPSQAAPRVARVSDSVSNGTAVRTGVDSRAELTFADLTITRLGANTVFTFNEGTRELDLGSGAILLQVPKGGVPVLISTPAVTAAISGGTALCESNKVVPAKLLVLEGSGRFCSKAHRDECETVHGGEMSMMTLDGHITKPVKFNAGLLFRTSKLIKGLPPLPNEALILGVIEQQQAYFSAGLSNPLPQEKDNIDVISARTDASPASTTTSGKFGPPSVITAPNPYVITSGTQISTDPKITTNGVTNFGKIYRGVSQDGPAAVWLYGSARPFDAFVFKPSGGGVQTEDGPYAAFKFATLELMGNPAISTTNGPTNLALVAVNNIFTSDPGGTLTLSGINNLFIGTQDGSINLGPEIAFAGPQHVRIYARGAGSDLTLSSSISARKIRLGSEGSVQVNATETTTPTGGNSSTIRIAAGKQTGVAINISSSAQLLALLDPLVPDTTGEITILASAPDNTGNNSQINVSGTVRADSGLVDIRHEGDGGVINLANADLRADIIKVAVLGTNGALNIGAGNVINADTTLQLYAGGSNGTLNFLSSVTLSSPENILAAKTINISQGVIVTINSANQADVFTDTPNYFGFGGTGNPSTTGTFGGAGAKNPQPFSSRPPLDAPGMALRKR